MALRKEKVFKNGISANYWKIESLAIDYRKAEIIVFLILFKDEVVRHTDGSEPVQRFNIKLPLSALNNQSEVRANIYASLKLLSILDKNGIEQNPVFGAEDC